ncbi:MAG: biotin/lipoyl-containing protein [Ferrimicrobium sp.]
MSTEVRFPELSKSDPSAQGVVATWFVTDGDPVHQGQLLAEVQVDKVDAEIPAPASGVVRILAAEQDIVTQSSVIAYID